MKTIAFGDVKALSAVFSFGGDRTLIVEAEPIADTLKFWELYGQDAKRADHYGLDDWSDRFFAFWVENCFDPSIAIVRADSFESAYETFCDEFADWIKIADSDLSDYLHSHDCSKRGQDLQMESGENCSECGEGSDRLNYNSSGVAIDTEAVQGREITLLRVIVNHTVE